MERMQRQGQKCLGILEIALVHMVRHQRLSARHRGKQSSSALIHLFFKTSLKIPDLYSWKPQSCQHGRQCLPWLWMEDPSILKTSNKQENYIFQASLEFPLCLQSSSVTWCDWVMCWGAEKAETSPKLASEFSLHREPVGVWWVYYMRKACLPRAEGNPGLGIPALSKAPPAGQHSQGRAGELSNS